MRRSHKIKMADPNQIKPEDDDVVSSFDLDFPYNVDFDHFSLDDLSFADNLLLLPEPEPEPDDLGVSGPISSSEESNSPDFPANSSSLFINNTTSSHSNGSNSDDNSCFSRKISDVVHANGSSDQINSGSGSGSGSGSKGVSKLRRKIDHAAQTRIDNDNDNHNHNDAGSGRKCELKSRRKVGNGTRISNTGSESGGGGGGRKCELRSKRKMEDEKDDDETRVSKFRRSNESVIESGDGEVEVEVEVEGGGDDKKKARLIRNRESAQLSRQRKKQYVEELEDKVRAMHSTITDLNSKVSFFMTENATLRQQLSSGRAGGGVGGGVVGPGGMYPPMPYPWMPYPPPYVMVNPHGSHVPLVPIPRLKPQQPAPATPKVKKSSEGKKEKGERKTKKVASVSLIGLLFFMFLFGGLIPMVNVRYNRVGNGFGGSENGAVFRVEKHGDGKFGHGRVLQQVNNSSVGNTSVPLVASLYVPRNDQLVKIDGNLIIHSVLASEKAMASQTAEGAKTTEETSLAIHVSYPPYPSPAPGSNSWRRPHLDRNQNGRQKALGSGSADFTPIGSDGKLQQWFREGLAGPMLSSGMCTEVFQFDVSPTPGSIVPATSLVANITSEDHLNSTRPNIPKNRRILPGHAIPFNEHTLNSTKDSKQPHESNDGLQSNKSRSSVVVSVLVDPREVGDGDGETIIGSKTLPRIFVVVLIDSVKYVTYSCMLPFMGSGSHLITA